MANSHRSRTFQEKSCIESCNSVRAGYVPGDTPADRMPLFDTFNVSLRPRFRFFLGCAHSQFYSPSPLHRSPISASFRCVASPSCVTPPFLCRCLFLTSKPCCKPVVFEACSRARHTPQAFGVLTRERFLNLSGNLVPDKPFCLRVLSSRQFLRWLTGPQAASVS